MVRPATGRNWSIERTECATLVRPLCAGSGFHAELWNESPVSEGISIASFDPLLSRDSDRNAPPSHEPRCGGDSCAFCGCERLLTGSNGNLPFARVARTLRRGGVESERSATGLAHACKHPLLSERRRRRAGGPSPPPLLTLVAELTCLGEAEERACSKGGQTRGSGGVRSRLVLPRSDRCAQRRSAGSLGPAWREDAGPGERKTAPKTERSTCQGEALVVLRLEQF